MAPFPNMAGRQNWQEGRKAKYDMETFDFLWHNTTRMHVFTYIAPKYQALMNDENNYGVEEAGMAQLDDDVGALPETFG
jgi:hypothetical protein